MWLRCTDADKDQGRGQVIQGGDGSPVQKEAAKSGRCTDLRGWGIEGV